MDSSVGILAPCGDLHALEVKRRIEERHPTRCYVIPGDALATRGGLTWSSDPGAASVLRSACGELVELARLDAFWTRRWAPTQSLPESADPAYAEHIHLASESALAGILLNELRGSWVSHPVATYQAENKLLQLRAAQRAGLRIPATLVSQDPARIRSFCADHAPAVVKAVRVRGEAVPTSFVSAELLADDDVLALAPAIYQELIQGERHLRVTMFGDRCHAVRIDARALDWRLDLSVPFSPYRLSQHLHTTLQEILRGLGLVMGVFDLKLAPDGEPVFIEVNPQGQFLFVEGLCGMRITESLADYLVELARLNAAKRETVRTRVAHV